MNWRLEKSHAAWVFGNLKRIVPVYRIYVEDEEIGTVWNDDVRGYWCAGGLHRGELPIALIATNTRTAAIEGYIKALLAYQTANPAPMEEVR